jgi:hypothetical protein
VRLRIGSLVLELAQLLPGVAGGARRRAFLEELAVEAYRCIEIAPLAGVFGGPPTEDAGAQLGISGAAFEEAAADSIESLGARGDGGRDDATVVGERPLPAAAALEGALCGLGGKAAGRAGRALFGGNLQIDLGRGADEIALRRRFVVKGAPRGPWRGAGAALDGLGARAAA